MSFALTTNDIAINGLLEKLSGDKCLYLGGSVTKSCIETNPDPDNLSKRPEGWCEVCWLTFQVEEYSLQNLKMRMDLKELRPKLQMLDGLIKTIEDLDPELTPDKHKGQLSLQFEYSK